MKKGTPIKQLKKKLDAVVASSKSDIHQYAGTVKLSIDPLKWQKKKRDEWE
ncbi:MAG: hypothetical protein AAGC88_08080 [Bacteroidota bacterium]